MGFASSLLKYSGSRLAGHDSVHSTELMIFVWLCWTFPQYRPDIAEKSGAPVKDHEPVEWPKS